MRVPPTAPHTEVVRAQHQGRVAAVDNRRLASIAKLAGAPKSAAAGLVFHAPIGAIIEVGQPYLTIHAESRGELDYALAYAEAQENIISLQED